MATYASLTDEQKKSCGDFMALLRPLAINHQKSLNIAQAIKNQYDLNLFTILSSLDSGELVLDSTGLAGAVHMNASDVMAMTMDAEALLTEDVTGRSARRTQAAGANNLIA